MMLKLRLKNAKLNCLVLALFFFQVSNATTYYVSTTGNDGGSGTLSNPYKTIAQAATMVAPGDTVLVLGGTYAEKNIIPASSGTAGAMIVFKPAPGTGDVIIRHPAASLSDNTAIFDLSNRNFIRVEGFQFKDFSYGRASVYISNGQGNVVINNRFENLGNNEVADGTATCAVYVSGGKENIIRNNYFNNIYGDGIGIKSNSTNNLVSENTFNNFKGKPRGWAPTGSFSSNMNAEESSYGNNIFAFNNSANGKIMIWFDRDASTNIVLRNVARNDENLFFNESRCARNIAQENIGYNITSPAFQSARYETGFTADARWINNVAYNCNTGFYLDKSDRNEVRNNITYNNTAWNIVFTDTAVAHGPHIFKNNLWFTGSNANSIQYKGAATAVPAFQTNVGETGGLSTNPLFSNLTAGSEDFTLQAGSPAAGTGDGGVNMGAYAVYGKTAVGWDSTLQTGAIEVSFDSPISSAERGETIQLTVSLNKASSSVVTVDIVPVAGDARSGKDFQLSRQVSFQPGETSKTVAVAVVGGSNHDELVALRLSNPVNAKVGAKNLRVLKLMKNANAGPDQTFVYKGQNIDVKLDGSGSNGTITSYVWSEGGSQVATGISPTVSLSLGTHRITLTITDSDGKSYTDDVVITIKQSADVWLEAECAKTGTLWNIETDTGASGGRYVTIEKGNNSSASAPADASGLLTYSFTVAEAGSYTLWVRVLCPDANGDSFWFKMDGDAFSSWNDITKSSSWIWVNKASTYNLAAGSHTLTIGYREDDAKLDKILLSPDGTVPDSVGADAGNCVVPDRKVVVKQEAETGTLGSDWDTRSVSGINYITPKTDAANSAYPGNATKVSSYSITFPQAGTYNLYIKMRVGTGGANDDSYYYGNGFGTKDPAVGNDWITCNSITGKGYSVETDIVDGAGSGSNNIWKWINMSKFTGTGSETPIAFTVPEGALTQTFQIGSRENGFDIDKIAFGIASSTFTVKELDDAGTLNVAPVIAAGQSFSVNENAPAETTVGVVSASDADGQVLQNWKITGGTGADKFTIDSLSGAIRVAGGALLDYEQTSSYTLNVKVSDGIAPSAVASVTINLNNLSDLVSSIRLTGGTVVYNGQGHPASGFAYGIGGDTDRLSPALSFIYKDSLDNILTGEPVTPGRYKVLASFAGDSNYLPSKDSTFITIVPKTLIITATDQIKLCGDSLSLGTTAFSAAGLEGTDTVTAVSLSSTAAGVGTYAIVPGNAVGTGLSNYNITYLNGSLTVQDLTAPVISFLPQVAPMCFAPNGTYHIPELEAVDQCGAITATYTITGATTRSGSGTNASGSFNVGTSFINWVVGDGHGNETTARTTVTVNSKVTASIPDVYALNASLDRANTLYTGYGPATLTLQAIAAGGTPAYSYLWNNGQTGQSLAVSTPGTYTVNIQDASGCTAVSSIDITTLDVTCGNNGDKVMVCHNGKAICVASGAVQAHLNHGDNLGACGTVTVAAVGSDDHAGAGISTQLSVYPNPVNDKINIWLGANEKQIRRIEMVNMVGNIVLRQQTNNRSEVTLYVQQLPAGVYVLRLIGDKAETFKIVKL